MKKLSIASLMFIILATAVHAEEIKTANRNEVLDAFQTVYASQCEEYTRNNCVKAMKAIYIQDVVMTYRNMRAAQALNISTELVVDLPTKIER